MKKYIVGFALVAGFLSACQKNDEEVPSGGGGLERDKFVGTYTVHSTHTITSPQTWDMDIVAGGGTDTIIFNRFDVNHANGVKGIVTGSSFTIPEQPASGQTFKGSGTYSNGTLTFTYTADDGVQVDTVSSNATKH
jgi:hypothetical protein